MALLKEPSHPSSKKRERKRALPDAESSPFKRAHSLAPTSHQQALNQPATEDRARGAEDSEHREASLSENPDTRPQVPVFGYSVLSEIHSPRATQPPDLSQNLAVTSPATMLMMPPASVPATLSAEPATHSPGASLKLLTTEEDRSSVRPTPPVVSTIREILGKPTTLDEMTERVVILFERQECILADINEWRLAEKNDLFTRILALEERVKMLEGSMDRVSQELLQSYGSGAGPLLEQVVEVEEAFHRAQQKLAALQHKAQVMRGPRVHTRACGQWKWHPL